MSMTIPRFTSQVFTSVEQFRDFVPVELEDCTAAAVIDLPDGVSRILVQRVRQPVGGCHYKAVGMERAALGRTALEAVDRLLGRPVQPVLFE
jgi:hypothetical protein